MSRIIYAIKIYLYRDQLDLNLLDLDAVQRFILFYLKCYIKFWFTSSLPLIAPQNDLNMLKAMDKLREVLPQSMDAGIKKLRGHLWYLSEYLVAVSFFDSKVSTEDKKSMVNNWARQINQRNPNRFELPVNCDIDNLSLATFVSEKTQQFFDILNISKEFLRLDRSQWHENEDYVNGKQVVSKLVVVNDAAERSIASYKSHHKLAKSSENREHVLQVVEHNRKRFKRLTKQKIITALEVDD